MSWSREEVPLQYRGKGALFQLFSNSEEIMGMVPDYGLEGKSVPSVMVLG